jgi:4-carboxymuconolactone decarboxylase
VSETSKREIGEDLVRRMTGSTNIDKTKAPIPVEVRDEFMDFTSEAAFGSTWARPGLALRDRSLVTIASLVTSGSGDELVSHIRLGLKNGLTRQEICEAIWHVAIYAGWPRAFQAFAVADKYFRRIDERAAASGA